MFDKLRIESKLAGLRQRWLKEPKNRSVIEIQAKCLKIALSKLEPPDNFKIAEEIFLKNKSAK